MGMKNEKERQMNWLLNEIKKDSIELDREKSDFINKIKNLKREEIVPKPQKLSLWQRIKIVLRMS
jgi:hypothetical protein